jgi:hypothetical protein
MTAPKISDDTSPTKQESPVGDSCPPVPPALDGDGTTTPTRRLRTGLIISGAVMAALMMFGAVMTALVMASAAAVTYVEATLINAIPLADLNNATLRVPDWYGGSGCVTGDQKFTNGETETSMITVGMIKTDIIKTAYIDIDHDHVNETVALLRCTIYPDSGGSPRYQVAAFDRSRTGRIVTVAQVVTTTPNKIGTIFNVTAGRNGSVRVELGNLNGCCPEGPSDARHQWRTYAFDGAHFNQTGGPTSFPVDPHTADLSVEGGKMYMSQLAGVGQGTLNVTVRNRGGRSIAQAELVFTLKDGLVPWGSGWSRCNPVTIGATVVSTCTLGAIRADDALFLQFGFRATTPPMGGGTVTVRNATDDRQTSVGDPAEPNNTAFVIPTFGKPGW